MIQNFSLSPFELAGITGFAIYVMNYSLLTLRRISGDCISYFVLNFSAASLVMIGLMTSFNLAAALIQGFWIAMSIVGITLRLRRRKTGSAPVAVTVSNSPDAPFQSARRLADEFPKTGSPDREFD